MSTHMASRRLRDPRQYAPVGAHMTDGSQLLEIVESDWSGALGENVVTDRLVELERIELIQQWRRVRPAKDDPA